MISRPWPLLAGLLVQAAAARDYAAFANEHPGRAENGRAVFAKLGCAACHDTDGGAGKAGPGLAAIADKFPRADLIRQILEPSAAIAVGYDTTLVTGRDGSVVSGIVKQSAPDWIELLGADGKPLRVATADIVKRETSAVSLMPPGLPLAGSPEDFADLVAYLGTLRLTAADAIPVASSPAVFEPFFDDSINFDEPVWFGEIPGRDHAYIVLEHRGQAWLVEKSPAGDRRVPVLDLREIVRAGGATGLLSMAFHPRFPADPRYFLNYQIAEAGEIFSLVVERRFTGTTGDSGAPPREILRIPAATQDHNGGCIAFGPDGFLYIGTGDTGPQRDPQGHGQDMALWWGKLLRIDVDRRDGDLPYAVPPDNPFTGQPGVRPEIWAAGFREPWRFSWDTATGDLWLGDVGQDRFEEVDIVRAGENFGWNVMEGFNAFSERYRRPGETFVPPVWSYSRRLGDSVTGGHVYRGKRAPRWDGWYVFGDHDSRRVWALTQRDRHLERVVEIGLAPSRAVSFTRTRDGELFVVGFNSGKIYRIDLAAADPRPAQVRVLAPTAEKSPVAARFTVAPPPDGWTAADFDDAAWTAGDGGFGTPGTPGAVVRTRWAGADIWLRREFARAAGEPPARLVLRVHHDEDAEIFLNGTRVAGLPRWTQGYEEISLPADAARALRPGRNVLAIHCHNAGGGQYIDAGLLEISPPAGDP